MSSLSHIMAEDEFPPVKLMAPLDALPRSSSTRPLPTTPTKEGDAVVLPCFPLHKQQDARIVPYTEGIQMKLVLTDSRYVEMMKHVEESQKVFSRWSKRFVATQIVRYDADEEEEEEVAEKSLPLHDAPSSTCTSLEGLQVEDTGSRATAHTGGLRMGAFARIQGLQSAHDLNGSLCKLLNFNDSSNRWEVRIFGSASSKAVRPENLVVVPTDDRPMMRGSLVCVSGIQKSPELNGSVGKLLSFNPKTNRWDVDIEDEIGVKSVKLENLEPAPKGIPHKAFKAWRTSADVGGQWCLAEVGVVLHLDKMKEVQVKKSKDGPAEKGYEVTLSASDRVRLRHVLNPEAFADRTTYLRVEVEDYVDQDSEDGENRKEDSARMNGLLREVLQLQMSSIPKEMNIMMDKKMVQRLESTGSMKPNLWKLVALWQIYLEIQTTAKQVSELAGGEVNMKSFRRKLKESRLELEAAVNKKIDEALPLQQLIQAKSSRERLRIFTCALQREKDSLQEKMEKVSLIDVLNSSTEKNKGKSWIPFPFPATRSKL